MSNLEDTMSSSVESSLKVYPNNMQNLSKTDPEIYNIIKLEEKRQVEKVRLIPSENYVSKAVSEAVGSVLSNKYSEGYIGKRYYEGQQNIDLIEEIAISRAKKLFGAEHANIQPYSGSPANMAVFFAFLKPFDKFLSMALPHGGHLTHGAKVSFSGTFFTPVHYTLSEKTYRLDYDNIRDLAKKERPKMIIAGASAYPRTIDFKIFSDIAKEVGAYFLADIAHIAGLVAAGLHNSPIPYADAVSTTSHKTLRGPRGGLILCKEEHKKAIDKAVFPGLQGGPHNNTTAGIAVALKEADTQEFKLYASQIIKNAKVLADELLSFGYNLVTGGTDNHLILIDLTNKNIPGKLAATVLDRVGIVLNANTVPFEKRTPLDPSGIRLGTPAVTSRGMKENDMKLIAKWIDLTLSNYNNEDILNKISNEVREFCIKFPAPGITV